jgi:hypothetical protein
MAAASMSVSRNERDMGGRYLDELRRIARAQSATTAAPGPAPEEPGPAPRRGGRSLFTVLVILVLVGAGWLMIRQLVADAKLQDCVMSGRKNCVPIEVEPVGP